MKQDDDRKLRTELIELNEEIKINPNLKSFWKLKKIQRKILKLVKK